MRVACSLVAVLSLLQTSIVAAKSSWSFEDATVQVQSKSGGETGVKLNKEKLSLQKPLASPVTLGSGDSIRVSLTALEEKKARRPHQAFVSLSETTAGLEESFPLGLKESGKGTISIAQKDIPVQLLNSATPLRASVVIGSFGSSKPFRAHVFDVNVSRDNSASTQAPAAPLRYGKLPEIHHIFRSDPKSPPVVITAVFACVIFMAPFVLLGTWLELGMNLNHLSEAFGTAPIAHGLFVGSILLLEFIFFLYYLRWSLFQTLPFVAAVGSVAFLSGSRALREVQGRRLAGKR